MKHLALTLFLVTTAASAQPAEDGYDLWLRYRPLDRQELAQHYGSRLRQLHIPGQSPTLDAARDELRRGLRGLLGHEPEAGIDGPGLLIAGTPETSRRVATLSGELESLDPEGYILRNTPDGIIIAAPQDIGVLYGAFHLLRLLQTHQSLDGLDIRQAPAVQLRLLNHWDNLDRTVERGYAGFSLWDWHRLPDHLPRQYTDYARANASLGINGTVLTNVNANALVITERYLHKAAALADLFRPYGIRVFLTARFSAPVEIGGLDTADPLDPEVRAWWQAKADQIYGILPDFGGFLVKANSEGQPGPQDYGRSHADGANMLADAVGPHGGVVMWRAFVYTADPDLDRAGQAVAEFGPLDGAFRDNVLVQVKNGPVDFQPREPFSPLFGAMPETPLMMEFQITKEYLGLTTHLAYLGALYEEVLDADTWATGEGSTVARVVDGSVHDHAVTGMAGVSNIGTDRTWCGSHFDCANWYAFGRLAWDPEASAEAIAREWLRMTFSNEPEFVDRVAGMMMDSRELAVDYRTPLGLAHLMAVGHHYGPGPWVDHLGRPEWNSVYYHRADSAGIGFDRTASGSGTVSQYAPEVAQVFGSLDRVPDEYLLWFHHVPWDHPMPSGRTLWEELAWRYQRGVDGVRELQQTWASMQPHVDADRHDEVAAFLKIQEREARWWRDACLLYFQTFSKLPIPAFVELAEFDLEHYRAILHQYVPGHPGG